ncbi:conserved hypothetical protein [Leishmania mexicana MHOM/GT/2001/U1103]|uniref:Uncharacterized protein n=1 Tax=Leishmania mexicana (strain MHOM/GT/2001/U1103) TaxID=929439 RepID=E9B282_LEIMU|nr:conserved hypothetical protein [Leishmania mexicana MHOM/GT/2001/U1103]CBZ29343.1 conserved hypothetical protein [Leishmania mexicana MHOM/GT/2001/U1103]
MMLRPTLVKWLERKSVRPIVERVARSTLRGPSVSHSATQVAAGSASSSLYRTGDIDDIDGAESLDMMDGIPNESFGLPAYAAPRRNAHAPEPRARTANSYHWSSGADSAGAGSGTVDHRDRPRRDERSASPTRRVITVARRHHSSPAEASSASHHAHAPVTHASLSSSPREALVTDHTKGAPHLDKPGHTAAPVNPSDANDSAGGTIAETGESAGSAATKAKSSDAYRFLLHHIDAEIAALQRRHASVTTRRQSVQTRQTQRIKELFEVMENPWTLLPTEVQPALPATGVDVYIKEQQIARQQQNHAHTIPEGQDKMYVLALHKNYKSMPAGRKRFYEEAAHYNAAVREELKYLLTRGCSRFEAFLDTIKECTMEMAREGQVPELPTTHAQNRFHAARGGVSNYRHVNTPKALPAGGDAGTTRSRRSHQHAQFQQVVAAQETSPRAEAQAEEGDTTAEWEDEGDTVEGAAKEAGRGARQGSVGRKRGHKASQRIKSAAKKKAPAQAAAAAAGAHSSTRMPKRRQGSQTSATRQPNANPMRRARGSSGAGTGANAKSDRKKTVRRAARSTGVSRSIPLPNLDHLAVKKIKRMLTSPSGAGGAAKKAAKAKRASASRKPAAGGAKKKR